MMVKLFICVLLVGLTAIHPGNTSAAEGLDVDIRELAPDKNPVTQVAARAADFGVGGSGIIYDSQTQLALSTEELVWLQQHPVIRVGIDRDFAPYEWIDKQGRYVGMTADYLRLIERRLKVRFDIVKDKPWPEILDMAKRGELDILSNAVKTPEREHYLRFTQPYFHHPIIIITANSRGYVGDLKHLHGKRVAVEKGYFMQEILTREHPEIRVAPFSGVREALQQTAAGKTDAYIGHAATASHTMKQQGMLQLSFAGETGYYGDHSIAVVKSSPLLYSILEKALASITEAERNKIQNDWMNLKIEQGLPLQTLLQYAAAALALLLLGAYWVYRLRREIGARRASETALRQSEAKLLAILEAEPECVKIVAADGRLTYMNRAGLAMIEAEDDPPKVLGQKVRALVVPEDRQAFEAMHRRVLQTQQECTLEFEIQGLKGTRRHMESHAIPFRDATEETPSVLSVTRDITERKAAQRQNERSQKMLDELAARIPVGVYTFRMHADGGMQFDYVSPRFCDLLGLEQTAVLRNAELAFATVHPEEQAEFIALNRQAAKTLETFFWEGRFIVQGCVRWLRLESSGKQAENGDSVWNGMVSDITERRLATMQLQQSEAKFRAIIQASPVPYALNDAEHIIFVNRAFTDTFGYTLDDVPTLAEWWPKAYPDAGYRRWIMESWQTRLEHAAKNNTAFEPLELNIRCKDGTLRNVMASAAALGESFACVHLVILYDITELKKNEEKLILAARVFSEAHEAIVITDADGKIVDVNPTYCEVTGYNAAEVIGKNPSILKSGKQSSEFYAAMWKTLLEGGHWRGEIWNRKKSGEIFPELLTISALRDAGGKIVNFIGLFSDITQIKHQQQALELMAHYDPLTQLPNRVLFADRFNQAVARSKRDKTLLGICYLDLDGFKPVNDTYGHEAGDVLLIEVAERIKDCLRDEDTISRLGGDEFALLLVDLHSLEQLEKVLVRVHHEIAKPFFIDRRQQVAVTASIGVTLFPLNDGDPDTLLRHADQAMYQAKLAGRNCYRLFDPALDKPSLDQRKNLQRIQQALSQGEFCLYYQPKVNMRSAEVVGAEGLLRWNHPEHGILPPAEFLSLIEEAALESALGEWVIESALQQLEAWKKLGLDLQISVNISPKHIQAKDFIKNLEAALARHPDIDSRLLELEVLESSVLVDLVAASNTLKECYHTLGVPFALDDFGTGYSSLTHLRRLPVTTIKIDQCFVRDMLEDIDDLAIVESVIGLAHAFKRTAIAEGVESMEHGLALLTLGCQIVQGYAVAEPMPAAAVPAWIRAYRPYAQWSNLAHNPPAPKQAQLLLLQIEVEQLVKRVGVQLHAPEGTPQHWPIMNAKKSYLRNWLIQAQQDCSVDQNLLDALRQDHDDLLCIGTRLKQLYQENKASAVSAENEELIAVQRRIRGQIAVLGEHFSNCERAAQYS